jgi:hypothetical protein
MTTKSKTLRKLFPLPIRQVGGAHYSKQFKIQPYTFITGPIT